MPLDKINHKHEEEKNIQYYSRVQNIEHGTFTPLVYSINGGLGPECEKFHQHLDSATKTDKCYEKVLTWMRCKLSFIIMRSALLCLRGSHSVGNLKAVDDFQLECENALEFKFS